jgi:hypothetical protein
LVPSVDLIIVWDQLRQMLEVRAVFGFANPPVLRQPLDGHILSTDDPFLEHYGQIGERVTRPCLHHHVSEHIGGYGPRASVSAFHYHPEQTPFNLIDRVHVFRVNGAFNLFSMYGWQFDAWLTAPQCFRRSTDHQQGSDAKDYFFNFVLDTLGGVLRGIRRTGPLFTDFLVFLAHEVPPDRVPVSIQPLRKSF